MGNALEYNPANMSTWAKAIGEIITGASDSYNAVVKKWGELLGTAVDNKVWVGAAAQTNYDLFIDVGNDFGKFFTDFETAFNAAMESVHGAMITLESENAVGEGVSYTSIELTDEQVETIEKLTTLTEVIGYDKENITQLATDITAVKDTLSQVTTALMAEVDKISAEKSVDDADMIWEGVAAAENKQAIKDVISNNMTTIEGDIDAVAKKVSMAAETATQVDSASE